MPPYSELDPTQRGILKFLRKDDQLIVGDPKTSHRDIAFNDAILINLLRARLEDKTRADAGLVEITEDFIYIYDQSTLLGAKIIPEARLKTLEAFKQQTTRIVEVSVRKEDVTG